jgi:hypothetical protein
MAEVDPGLQKLPNAYQLGRSLQDSASPFLGG